MRTVSDAYNRTVRGSHTAIFRARVCSTFQTGTSPVGTEIPIFGGDVVADATADVRATVDLETDGTRMWPSRDNLLLAPFGGEVYAERGVQYGNGVEEWVGLGYYRIQSPDQSDVPDGPIRIEGRDRMAGLIDGRLRAPRQFGPAATYGTVVTQLVTAVYPLATIEWDDTTDTQTLGRSLIVEEDRHGFLKDLVTSLGKIWYWDHRGVLVIRSPPSTDTPVFDMDAGAGGVLVSMSRQLTREGVYNAVVASGESTDTEAPVRAVATNDDPDSPTFFGGAFGPVPLFFSSAFLRTTAQARAAADTILRRHLGLPYKVNFAAVPNAALEPWDPVRIRYSHRDAVETHVLQSVTIPLTPEGVMSATTREQTVTLIGDGT